MNGGREWEGDQGETNGEPEERCEWGEKMRER